MRSRAQKQPHPVRKSGAIAVIGPRVVGVKVGVGVKAVMAIVKTASPQ